LQPAGAAGRRRGRVPHSVLHADPARAQPARLGKSLAVPGTLGPSKDIIPREWWIHNLEHQGIVLLYNARNAAGDAGDRKLPEGAYAAGQVLLDAKDPRRVLARTDEGFLHPDRGHEKQGQVANVVFVEGLVPFQGRWLLYFGAADSRLALAAAPMR